MNFSYWKMIGKGAKYWAIFAASLIIAGFIANSPLANMTVVDLLANTVLGKLTIGALLVMFLNWLKVKVGVEAIP